MPIKKTHTHSVIVRAYLFLPWCWTYLVCSFLSR